MKRMNILIFCHVFWECMFTQHLWQKVYKYIFKTKEPVNLPIYLGVDDVKEGLIIIQCKKIIYLSQILECIIPTYNRFITYLHGVKHMEFLVAEKRNEVDVWFEMWSDV